MIVKIVKFVKPKRKNVQLIRSFISYFEKKNDPQVLWVQPLKDFKVVGIQGSVSEDQCILELQQFNGSKTRLRTVFNRYMGDKEFHVVVKKMLNFLTKKTILLGFDSLRYEFWILNYILKFINKTLDLTEFFRDFQRRLDSAIGTNLSLLKSKVSLVKDLRETLPKNSIKTIQQMGVHLNCWNLPMLNKWNLKSKDLSELIKSVTFSIEILFNSYVDVFKHQNILQYQEFLNLLDLFCKYRPKFLVILRAYLSNPNKKWTDLYFPANDIFKYGKVGVNFYNMGIFERVEHLPWKKENWIRISRYFDPSLVYQKNEKGDIVMGNLAEPLYLEWALPNGRVVVQNFCVSSIPHNPVTRPSFHYTFILTTLYIKIIQKYLLLSRFKIERFFSYAFEEWKCSFLYADFQKTEFYFMLLSNIVENIMDCNSALYDEQLWWDVKVLSLYHLFNLLEHLSEAGVPVEMYEVDENSFNIFCSLAHSEKIYEVVINWAEKLGFEGIAKIPVRHSIWIMSTSSLFFTLNPEKKRIEKGLVNLPNLPLKANSSFYFWDCSYFFSSPNFKYWEDDFEPMCMDKLRPLIHFEKLREGRIVVGPFFNGETFIRYVVVNSSAPNKISVGLRAGGFSSENIVESRYILLIHEKTRIFESWIDWNYYNDKKYWTEEENTWEEKNDPWFATQLKKIEDFWEVHKNSVDLFPIFTPQNIFPIKPLLGTKKIEDFKELKNLSGLAMRPSIEGYFTIKVRLWEYLPSELTDFFLSNLEKWCVCLAGLNRTSLDGVGTRIRERGGWTFEFIFKCSFEIYKTLSSIARYYESFYIEFNFVRPVQILGVERRIAGKIDYTLVGVPLLNVSYPDKTLLTFLKEFAFKNKRKALKPLVKFDRYSQTIKSWACAKVLIEKLRLKYDGKLDLKNKRLIIGCPYSSLHPESPKNEPSITDIRIEYTEKKLIGSCTYDRCNKEVKSWLSKELQFSKKKILSSKNSNTVIKLEKNILNITEERIIFRKKKDWKTVKSLTKLLNIEKGRLRYHKSKMSSIKSSLKSFNKIESLQENIKNLLDERTIFRKKKDWKTVRLISKTIHKKRVNLRYHLSKK